MGWDFGKGDTKLDVIEHCTKNWTNTRGQKRTCIAHTVKDNILWAVWDGETDTDVKRIIVCSLLRKEPGYGWGHKSIPELFHPYYYTCPLIYLAMVPVACKEWRERVVGHHRIWYA